MRTNAQNHSYTGTASAVKIIDANPDRTYICFYGVSGDSKIVIGSGDFDSNAITIPEGVMWEPRLTLTREVYLKGTGAVLTVLY